MYDLHGILDWKPNRASKDKRYGVEYILWPNRVMPKVDRVKVIIIYVLYVCTIFITFDLLYFSPSTILLQHYNFFYKNIKTA